MATRIKKYCPHCLREFDSRNYYGPKHKGSPIVCCEHCGKTFLDKDAVETAIVNNSPHYIGAFDCILAGLFPFGFLGAAFIIGAILDVLNGDREILGIIGGVIIFFGVIYTVHNLKNMNKLNDAIYEDYEESRNRVSDKEYVQALIDLEYKFPEDWLEMHHPDLLRIQKNK